MTPPTHLNLVKVDYSHPWFNMDISRWWVNFPQLFTGSQDPGDLEQHPPLGPSEMSVHLWLVSIGNVAATSEK